MATRQPPSPAVEPKNDTVRRTSSTAMSWRSLPVFSLIDALQHQQIAVRLRRDPPRHRVIGVDMRASWRSAPRARAGSGWASTKRAMR